MLLGLLQNPRASKALPLPVPPARGGGRKGSFPAGNGEGNARAASLENQGRGSPLLQLIPQVPSSSSRLIRRGGEPPPLPRQYLTSSGAVLWDPVRHPGNTLRPPAAPLFSCELPGRYMWSRL